MIQLREMAAVEALVALIVLSTLRHPDDRPRVLEPWDALYWEVNRKLVKLTDFKQRTRTKPDLLKHQHFKGLPVRLKLKRVEEKEFSGRGSDSAATSKLLGYFDLDSTARKALTNTYLELLDRLKQPEFPWVINATNQHALEQQFNSEETNDWHGSVELQGVMVHNPQNHQMQPGLAVAPQPKL
jgi:hypothetical protein